VSFFLDTSGIIALIESDDPNHGTASRIWDHLMDSRRAVLTTNYVIVETTAVLHARRGIAVVRHFSTEIMPVLRVEWIGPDVHDVALAAVIAGGRRGPSIVDCVSFEVMRRNRITEALAFDRHFTESGYSFPT